MFGVTHGILAVDRFYENVQRVGKNLVLELNPRTGQEMLVACLWSRWVGSWTIANARTTSTALPPESGQAGDHVPRQRHPGERARPVRGPRLAAGLQPALRTRVGRMSSRRGRGPSPCM
jgi:hypothetical protein